MSDFAVRVVNLGKEYNIGQLRNTQANFREMLAGDIAFSLSQNTEPIKRAGLWGCGIKRDDLGLERHII